MYQIIMVLTLGVIIGKFIREAKIIRYISKGTLVGVAALLFVMGAQIGSNSDVLKSLPILGGKATVFALFSIAGAVVVSLPLSKRVVK